VAAVSGAGRTWGSALELPWGEVTRTAESESVNDAEESCSYAMTESERESVDKQLFRSTKATLRTPRTRPTREQQYRSTTPPIATPATDTAGSNHITNTTAGDGTTTLYSTNVLPSTCTPTNTYHFHERAGERFIFLDLTATLFEPPQRQLLLFALLELLEGLSLQALLFGEHTFTLQNSLTL
jgi:hypothetical protein